jgi:hypothetical protein
MPNSGTVTAGSVALASQYNNLRADVLNITTGHTHTGAADAGAQIEGTALKSTGATAGHVLTAGTGGTATTWAALPAGGGAFTAGTFVSGTVSTFANGTATTRSGYPITSTGASAVMSQAVVTGSGTVLIGFTHGYFKQATSRNVAAFYLDQSGTAGTAISAINSTSVSQVSSGTTYWGPYSGYGFDASGDSWVVAERSTSSGTARFTLRKFTTSATNNWNTTIKQSTTGTVDAEYAYGPFYGGVRYDPGNGIWYGGDYVSSGYSAVTALSTASVFIVNDSSGSVYSAPVGTGVVMEVMHAIRVPQDGTATTGGTIYAVARQTSPSAGATAVRVLAFTVGSASITLAGTAISGPSMTSLFGETPRHIEWDNTQGKIIVIGSSSISFWNRTFTTQEDRSQLLSNYLNNSTGFDDGSNIIQRNAVFSPQYGLLLANQQATYPRVLRLPAKKSAVAGGFSQYGIVYMSPFYYSSSDYGAYQPGVLCGPGSPTFFAVGALGLGAPYDHYRKLWSAPIAGDVAIQVLGTASGSAYRLAIVTFGGPATSMSGYECEGAIPLTITTSGTAAGYSTNTWSMLVPATSTLKVWAQEDSFPWGSTVGNTTASVLKAKADVIQLA